jgi:hypothetical protein
MALKDSDNLKRIEALRPRFEKLREAQIRNDADRQRADRDLLQAQDDAIRIAGTADLDELRLKITADYDANTKVIDEFEAILTSIESGLADIEAEA